jgi:hypothetical protein
MTDELPIVLLHGSATGSYSWAAVRLGVVQGIDYLEGNLRLGSAWKSERGTYNLVLFVLTQQPATG